MNEHNLAAAAAAAAGYSNALSVVSPSSTSSVQAASLDAGLPGVIEIIVVLVRRSRKNCPTSPLI